jgi:3-hydroxyisobutyrate dehydrogenase-like beta-hydroxyacid dehydrogenase
MSGKMVIGFIGLGNMGAPMAQRIVAAGWPLQVWARRPQSLESLLAQGAVAAASPRALAAACDLVEICVGTDNEVTDVVLHHGHGVLAGMRSGTILALHSTLLPKTVIELERSARARGVHVLDAPVSGGAKGAAAGTLTVMVGGEAAHLARALPVFQSFASNIPHLGPVGSGQMMKLLNNNLCYANIALGISALELAEKLGFDPTFVASIIKVSSGGSAGFNVLIEESSFRKLSGPTSSVPKDVGHLLEVLRERGLSEEPLTRVSRTTADRIAAYAKHVTG